MSAHCTIWTVWVHFWPRLKKLSRYSLKSMGNFYTYIETFISYPFRGRVFKPQWKGSLYIYPWSIYLHIDISVHTMLLCPTRSLSRVPGFRQRFSFNVKVIIYTIICTYFRKLLFHWEIALKKISVEAGKNGYSCKWEKLFVDPLKKTFFGLVSLVSFINNTSKNFTFGPICICKD